MMQKKTISLLVAGVCSAWMGSAMAADVGANVSVSAAGVTAQPQVEVKTDGLQNSSAQLQENLNAKAAQADQGLNKALDAHAAATAKADTKVEAKADDAKVQAQGNVAAESAVAAAEGKAKEKSNKAKEEADKAKEKSNNASAKAKKWKKGQQDKAAKAADKAKADAAAGVSVNASETGVQASAKAQ